MTKGKVYLIEEETDHHHHRPKSAFLLLLLIDTLKSFPVPSRLMPGMNHTHTHIGNSAPHYRAESKGKHREAFQEEEEAGEEMAQCVCTLALL